MIATVLSNPVVYEKENGYKKALRRLSWDIAAPMICAWSTTLSTVMDLVLSKLCTASSY
jgi:hypothetical protein